MKFELLIIVSSEELEKYKSNIRLLDKYLAPSEIVIVGDDRVGAILSDYKMHTDSNIRYVDIKQFTKAETIGDVIAMYSDMCVNDYYLYWEIDVIPTQSLATECDGHPIFYIAEGIEDRILLANKNIACEMAPAYVNSNMEESFLGRYLDYVINNYPELYFSGEMNVFSRAGKFFELNKINDADCNWLSKDYDLLIFEDGDEFVPEYGFFFADEKYREKLSPAQIYDVVKAEAQIEDSSDAGETSYEYGFSALIEQEIRKGNDIIICPFEEEGRYFKQLLNEKYGINEFCIVDNDLVGKMAGVISVSELSNIDTTGKAIIINASDYEKNLGLAINIHNKKPDLRIISPFGAVETMVPGRKAFINRVRELTEIKKVITDKKYIRVGAKNDGGYIMLDDFSPSMKAYSYGINNDVSWDKQMANDFDMDIYMYDHTIDGLPEENSHFNYFKKGIAGTDRPEELLFSLSTCLKDNGHDNCDNLILKMDVEGAEWEMINETPSSVIDRFRQIAFEMHDFDHPEKEEIILSALEKMNKTHFPVWIHGNNHVSAICTDEVILPTAVEILYLNRRVYDYKSEAVDFPWGLDAPNTEIFPEYILGNWGCRDEKEGENAMDYEAVKSKLLNDVDFVGELSDKLLTVPSLFGPIDRVSLSPSSNIQNAIINTMSGCVFVGDNSFCGHNVSIITGSLDAAMTGEARMQFPCTGNDIVIGNGVWICSNAVILGPCHIADNAVIAAGSVVLPGTNVGEGEVWAGVPATYKKRINTDGNADTDKVGPIFDTIIVITPNDFRRVQSNYKRMLDNLPSNRLIFVGNAEVGELVEKSNLGDRAGFICEDDILPFDEVNKVMYEHLKEWLGDKEMPRGFTGWYYQQFIKMQYAYISNNEYYMSWDGDTIPCKRFSMFKDNGVPYMDYKHEYHKPYFETMAKLVPGLRKFIEPSFISEHMLFSCEIMKKLVESIEANDSIPGEKFYEKIIHSIEPANIQNSYFSEFETYGSFVCATNPSSYGLREWHSFRLAGQFFNPDTISDSDYEWLSHDFEAVSFEKGMTVRDDHKNLFDNKEYQSKLSARQMLEIAQEEFIEGYKEVWE